jgi:uncharacterized membrane protein
MKLQYKIIAFLIFVVAVVILFYFFGSKVAGLFTVITGGITGGYITKIKKENEENEIQIDENQSLIDGLKELEKNEKQKIMYNDYVNTNISVDPIIRRKSGNKKD